MVMSYNRCKHKQEQPMASNPTPVCLAHVCLEIAISIFRFPCKQASYHVWPPFIHPDNRIKDRPTYPDLGDGYPETSIHIYSRHNGGFCKDLRRRRRCIKLTPGPLNEHGSIHLHETGVNYGWTSSCQGRGGGSHDVIRAGEGVWVTAQWERGDGQLWVKSKVIDRGRERTTTWSRPTRWSFWD